MSTDTDLVTADDALVAAEALASALDGPAARDDDPRWNEPAADVEWPCRATLGHVADCALWYGGLLARRAPGPVEVPENSPTAAAPMLVDALRSGAALLATAIRTAGPDDRGWHAFGIADRSGFAAMACDEILVHGADIAATLGVDFTPDADLCARVVERLFPWVEVGADPWAALRFANGRQSLDGIEPRGKWKWHCAPLSEWDGTPGGTSNLR
ncbi:MAG TPA: maleylpyruvate isomerase N-terminal domain-containing protein [Acidimicrobiia bacterium]|jgi:uncharacterized protein (TIGR03083 family)|nr:maleylpyruvate isomerase N-terminal domain-containing protein [Acidimicrobiia bacterium]